MSDAKLFEVVLYELGYGPEQVFTGTEYEATEFARECEADTVGPCRFLVRPLRRHSLPYELVGPGSV
jgi:hypothetical protein